jgi:hypothetical protein
MGNKPIKEWKIGSIKSVIWQNEREINDMVVGFKTVGVSRSFKKKDEDIWRSEVINLRRNDLQKMILVLQKAQEYLMLEDKEESEDNE